MKVLAIGDIVGKNSVAFLQQELPKLKRSHAIDVCVVNGENAADGNGITPSAVKDLFLCGADVITTGNHAFRRKEIYDTYEETDCLLRPANYPDGCPGHGICRVDKGRYQVGVINLMGTTYMEPLENPFLKVDSLLQELSDCRIILVDFHAEATSEKRAMGFYLDGRVSAVYGTHTHVQTADEQVLPSGTGYMTDLGMTGPVHSVLGVAPQIVIHKFKTNLPARFDYEKNSPLMLNGCIFELDEKNGRCINCQRVCLQQTDRVGKEAVC